MINLDHNHDQLGPQPRSTWTTTLINLLLPHLRSSGLPGDGDFDNPFSKGIAALRYPCDMLALYWSHPPMRTTTLPSKAAILFFLGVLVFAFALCSKWLKWNGGSALLVVGSVLTMASCIRTRGSSNLQPVNTARLAVGLFFLYATFRLLYWPGAVLIALLVVAAAGWSFLHQRSPGQRAARFSAGAAVLATVLLMAVPVHALYGYMMFSTPGAQRFHNTGCGNWYRYSWLLYQDGQYAKSAAMIDSAVALVHDHHKRTGTDGEWLLVKLHATHDLIDDRQWDHFEELAP